MRAGEHRPPRVILERNRSLLQRCYTFRRQIFYNAWQTDYQTRFPCFGIHQRAQGTISSPDTDVPVHVIRVFPHLLFYFNKSLFQRR